MISDDRRKQILSIHRRLKEDKMIILAHLYDIYEFISKNINGIGEYVYPLSDTFKDSNVVSIQFVVRRIYRSRTKFELNVYMQFRDEFENTGVTSTLLSGTEDEISREIRNPDIAVRLAGFLFGSFESHYFSGL